jgi:uncharacterized membrane protein YbaN (DUF454 family)
MMSVLRICFGSLLILLGLVGLVLPVLQGVLFLAMGIVVLSSEVPLLARFLAKIEDRFPRIRQALQRLRGTLGSKAKSPPCPPDDC